LTTRSIILEVRDKIRDWPVGKVATFQQQNKTVAKLTNWVLARMLESDKVQALSLSD